MLTESLNNPWKLYNVTDKEPFNMVAEMSKIMMEYTEFDVYLNSEMTDLVIVGFRNNAWEIHHVKANDFLTAYKLNNVNPPMRFVATLLSISIKKLKLGDSVRFIATNEMMPNYIKLINLLVRKFGNNKVNIGKINNTEYQGKQCKEVVVSPNEKVAQNIV